MKPINKIFRATKGKTFFGTILIVCCSLLPSMTFMVGCQENNFTPSPPGFISTLPPVDGIHGEEGYATITITDVTVASPPVVEFFVVGPLPDLFPMAGLNPSNFRFTIAKLVPAAMVTGDADVWVSYINEEENYGGGAGGDGMARDTVQGESENDGILEDLGMGMYRYTFATDLENVTTPIAVAFEPNLTHRVGMELRGDIPRGDAVYTFVPNGSAVSFTKEVVNLASCNECHGKLSLHGEGRFNTKHCVTCHTAGSADANSGNSIDFKVMIHKIHMSEGLNNLPYVIWGFGMNDFSNIVYPLEFHVDPPPDSGGPGRPNGHGIIHCTKCHNNNDAMTPDADNWNTRPTMAACTSCHDDIDFSTGANHGPGIIVADNSSCQGCHHPTGNDPDRDIIDVHEGVFQSNSPHTAAADYEFRIISATNTGPGEQPVVVVQTVNPNAGDAPYDLINDACFTNNMNINLAWDTLDYTNEGTSGTLPARVPSIQVQGNATDNGDGTYTVNTGITIPANAVGTLAVGIEDHPCNLPVNSVVAYFPITDSVAVPRREIVDINKCNSCHGNLSLHGENRTNSIAMCAMCHNPRNTDIRRRPAWPGGNGTGPCGAGLGVDGKLEETIDFKYMIHAIHAGDDDEHGFREEGIVIYGFGGGVDYSHVRYPNNLNNCLACHFEGTYELPLSSDVLATTISACPDLVDQTDDTTLGTAAYSVCSSCHDGGLP